MKSRKIKRLLVFTIVLMTFVSCAKIPDTETIIEEETESIAEDINSLIYLWDYSQLKETVCYGPYEEGYEESQKEEFVRSYLQEHNVNKETPDGITYDFEGNPFVEYYRTGENQICFIVHIWGSYLIDFEANERVDTDAVYCVTLQIGEEQKAGNIIYNIDTKNNTTCERLYDAQGKQIANVTYEYIANVPIPFVTDYWDTDSGYGLIETLCREQKFWLYKELSEFDENENFIAYAGSSEYYDWKEYLPEPSICVYGEDGRFEALQEIMLEEDIERGWGWWDETVDYSGQIKFNYRDNGKVESVEYFRSSYSHGTYDSSGELYYDDDGRMISNEHYVTHGHHINILLYEEGVDRPWACLYWCSFTNGFDTIYIFQ